LLPTWRKEKTDVGEEDSNHGKREPETTIATVYASILRAYIVESHTWKWYSISACGIPLVEWTWSGLPPLGNSTGAFQNGTVQ